jgi:hypothetical protein
MMKFKKYLPKITWVFQYGLLFCHQKLKRNDICQIKFQKKAGRCFDVFLKGGGLESRKARDSNPPENLEFCKMNAAHEGA